MMKKSKRWTDSYCVVVRMTGRWLTHWSFVPNFEVFSSVSAGDMVARIEG